MAKQSNGKSKKGLKTIGGLGVTATGIALVLMFLFGDGFGFGTGNGSGDGAGTNINTEASQSQESAEPTTAPTEEPGAELSTVVIIKIEEDKVYFGDQLCEDAEALKALVEAANTDDRVFELEDNNSILATYEWVIGVFKDLEIPLAQ